VSVYAGVEGVVDLHPGDDAVNVPVRPNGFPDATIDKETPRPHTPPPRLDDCMLWLGYGPRRADARHLGGGGRRRIFTASAALVCIGLGDVVLGLTPSGMYVVALGTQIWVGFMAAMANASYGAILQATVDPNLQGRVFTLSSSVSQAVAPISLMIAGPVADWLGIQFWILTAGIACTLMGIAMFGTPSVMTIERGHDGISGVPSGHKGSAESSCTS